MLNWNLANDIPVSPTMMGCLRLSYANANREKISICDLSKFSCYAEVSQVLRDLKL